MGNGTLSLRWRWGIAAASAMLLLSLGAQFLPWKLHDRSWSGSYFSCHSDEAPYAAYVQALIDGRPRRTDPYSGRDDKPDAPQPESIFSVQFIPAYIVAIPARLLGISAQTSFIVVNCLLALASVLVLYWLIAAITGDERFAVAGALMILCCGSLSRSPVVMRFVGSSTGAALYLPFLRTYLPSVPFPLFFLFLGLVWLAITNRDRRKSYVSAIAAGLVMAILIFSYFYLWTAAAGWLALFTLLLLLARPLSYQRDLKRIVQTSLLIFLALIPYAWLLRRRAATTDQAQALTHSHRPDLLRPSAVIGLIAVAIIFLLVRRRSFDWKERRVLFTLSLALTPMLVFNQQILTGYSLQPVHYEQYVTNYVALLSFVLTIALVFRKRIAAKTRDTSWVLALAALLFFSYGTLEMVLGARALSGVNQLRDEVRPAALRLAQIGAASPRDPNVVVMATNLVQADNLPVDAPQSVLWAPHMRSFAGVSLAEDKERYYKLLYYSGTTDATYANLLRRSLIAASSVFGWDRINPHLTSEPNPISEAEIANEVRNYAAFTARFDRQMAAQPTLSYVVTPAGNEPDLTNLDRWYLREPGERLGNVVLYRVSLR